MDETKISRINELYRKQKAGTLTDEAGRFAGRIYSGNSLEFKKYSGECIHTGGRWFHTQAA